MNFLSKRRFVADDAADNDKPNKIRKKDRKRATEEEISSYFAPKRPALAETSLNRPNPREVVAKNAGHIDDTQQQSSTVLSIRPTIETPGLPELTEKNSVTQSIQNTYFTWSDSLRHSSQPAVIRPASKSGLEGYTSRSASMPVVRKKVRASSYDIWHPDPVERKQPVRRQTTRDQKQNIEDVDEGLVHAEPTTTPSLILLNQRRELEAERTTLGSNCLPRTADGSVPNIGTHPLPPANGSPTRAAQQQEPVFADNNMDLGFVDSTPAVMKRQDPTYASIANLLNDCDTAFIKNTAIRTPRLQPADLEDETGSRSKNEASTTRHHIPRKLRASIGEAAGEELLSHERDGQTLDDYAPQLLNPRMLDTQYYMYESDEEEEEKLINCIHPDVENHQEFDSHYNTLMPTQWPQHETHYNPAVGYSPTGELLMEDVEEEQEAVSELDFAEEDEDEEDDGLAGFWRPNMLY